MQDNETNTWLARDGDGRILEVGAEGYPGAEARPNDGRLLAEAAGPDEAARSQADAELARELGLPRPYVSGPRVGECPGSAEYGHGMSLTTVHLGCCQRWEAAQKARDAGQRDVGREPGHKPPEHELEAG